MLTCISYLNFHLKGSVEIITNTPDSRRETDVERQETKTFLEDLQGILNVTKSTMPSPRLMNLLIYLSLYRDKEIKDYNNLITKKNKSIELENKRKNANTPLSKTVNPSEALSAFLAYQNNNTFDATYPYNTIFHLSNLLDELFPAQQSTNTPPNQQATQTDSINSKNFHCGVLSKFSPDVAQIIQQIVKLISDFCKKNPLSRDQNSIDKYNFILHIPIEQCQFEYVMCGIRNKYLNIETLVILFWYFANFNNIKSEMLSDTYIFHDIENLLSLLTLLPSNYALFTEKESFFGGFFSKKIFPDFSKKLAQHQGIDKKTTSPISNLFTCVYQNVIDLYPIYIEYLESVLPLSSNSLSNHILQLHLLFLNKFIKAGDVALLLLLMPLDKALGISEFMTLKKIAIFDLKSSVGGKARLILQVYIMSMIKTIGILSENNVFLKKLSEWKLVEFDGKKIGEIKNTVESYNLITKNFFTSNHLFFPNTDPAKENNYFIISQNVIRQIGLYLKDLDNNQTMHSLHTQDFNQAALQKIRPGYIPQIVTTAQSAKKHLNNLTETCKTIENFKKA